MFTESRTIRLFYNDRNELNRGSGADFPFRAVTPVAEIAKRPHVHRHRVSYLQKYPSGSRKASRLVLFSQSAERETPTTWTVAVPEDLSKPRPLEVVAPFDGADASIHSGTKWSLCEL